MDGGVGVVSERRDGDLGGCMAYVCDADGWYGAMLGLQ
jgi:hypothetical protein